MFEYLFCVWNQFHDFFYAGDEGNNDEDSSEKDPLEKNIYKLPVPETLATNAFNEEESLRVPLVPAQAMDKSFVVEVILIIFQKKNW